MTTPPELAVGTVVEHVNLIRFRLDGADLVRVAAAIQMDELRASLGPLRPHYTALHYKTALGEA